MHLPSWLLIILGPDQVYSVMASFSMHNQCRTLDMLWNVCLFQLIPQFSSGWTQHEWVWKFAMLIFTYNCTLQSSKIVFWYRYIRARESILWTHEPIESHCLWLREPTPQFWLLAWLATQNYRIVPCKHPSQCMCQPFNFDRYVGFLCNRPPY